ncbi:hypothetical protein [Streptomyces boluensis]|uniref:Uncharacterized protein n=1 Tax=Streptomyces boluensis TaxID=1775135 RepID=A0A964XK47_9ACTN|nr:hypothetical protein [Streptomyces boluensis]NBE51999.1 hypothetical protein [Streptomyces boluensis]
MTTVVDRLRGWQGWGGPDLWDQAWERAVAVVEGPLSGHSIIIDGVVLAEGAAGLATALYLVSADLGVEPSRVTEEQIQALYGGDMPDEERTALWEARLTALGHVLDDTSDPVIRVWNVISHFHKTPGGDYDDTVDAASMTRWGCGYTAGMRKLRRRFDIAL